MMVRREGRKTIVKARIFYTTIILCIILAFLSFENLLKKSIKEGNYSYCISYFTLILVSFWLFNIAGTNPGYADSTPKQNAQTRDIELETSIVAADRPAHSLEINVNPQTESRMPLLSPQQNNIELRNSDHQSNGQNNNSSRSLNFVPEQKYCEVCRIIQPYRTRHCIFCEKCVCKFDHHCALIGGCVGELNHRKFWIFLLSQTILQLWTYAIANSGINFIYAKTVDLVDNDGNPIDYLEEDNYTRLDYYIYLLIAFVIFISTIFTGALLLFHTMLILTNQTTWEFTRKTTLSYLRMYPRSFHPFSKGGFENIKMIFFHGNKTRKWELPPIPVESN